MVVEFLECRGGGFEVFRTTRETSEREGYPFVLLLIIKFKPP